MLEGAAKRDQSTSTLPSSPFKATSQPCHPPLSLHLQAVALLNQALQDAGLEEASPCWICKTCRGALNKNKLPSLCVANKLHLVPIPEELDRLNIAELRQITQVSI